MGHTGTLDPLASGLLVLLLGRATRLSRYVTGLSKTYTATARFGARSSTLDAEGVITRLDHASMPDEGALRAATARFTGELLQIPPMASAIKVGGERLYKAHRRGDEVSREPRPVTVHRFDLQDVEGQHASFYVSCSSGTYVRALVADLAESLGSAAYLTALRRESVGHLGLGEAASPDGLTPENLRDHTTPMEDTVSHLSRIEVGAGERNAVCSGRSLAASGLSGSYRVEHAGELLAVFRDEGAVARPEVVLCAG